MKERVLKLILLVTPVIILSFVLINIQEEQNLFPNSSFYLPLGVFLIYLGIIFWFSRKSKTNENRAKSEGFENFNHKKMAKELGFLKAVEFKNAKTLGFLTNNIKAKVNEAGFRSVAELKLSWQLEHHQVNNLAPKLENYDIKKICTSSKSLNEILDDNLEIEPIAGEIDQTYTSVSKTYNLQNEVMLETKKFKKMPLLNFDDSELDNLYLQTQRDYDKVNNLKNYKNNIWDARMKWLQPFRPLLTLIELTQDGYPIDLGRISKVMQCSENRAEELLFVLLKNNESLGVYEFRSQVFTKGIDISNDLKELQVKIQELQNKNKLG